jgi:hypothetical protein
MNAIQVEYQLEESEVAAEPLLGGDERIDSIPTNLTMEAAGVCGVWSMIWSICLSSSPGIASLPF